MSNHLYDLPVPIYKTISPPRPKHQTHRSITEASFPVPKRSHHHHHIHRHHKDKERDKDSLRSGQPVEGTKSEGVSPQNSREQSRRTSLLPVSGEIEGLVVASSWKEERRVVRAEEVAEEKEKGYLRATWVLP
jgi:CHASE2 domain-containing sensor protein